MSPRVALLFLLFVVPSRAEPAFTVGAATRDITPEPGVSLNGNIARSGKAGGANDPLMVRATVIESLGRKIAIAIVDACHIGAPVFDEARRLVTKRTGIPGANVLMAATHTHAAPRALHIGRLSALDDAWHAELSRRLAEAIAEADASREPARLFAGKLDLPELVASRRFVCEPGSVPPDPFGRSGELVSSVQSTGPARRIGPAGPVDPAFSMLYAARHDGSPLMLLGNFGVHYCGGYAGARVSSDYFGAFCRNLEKQLAPRTNGRRFTAIHSNGTSGDVGALGTPKELAGRQFRPFERCEAVGAWLAGRIRAELEHLTPLKGDAIDAELRPLTFGVRKPAPERLAWARDIVATKIPPPSNKSLIYADNAIKMVALPDRLTLPVQVLRLGELTIAGSPCETFAETGLAIKAARSAAPTFTIELANGYGGYLPTAEQHRLGGYETWDALSSFLEIAAEARLRAALIEMVSEQE